MSAEKKFRDYTREITEYFRDNGMKVDPEPNLVLKQGAGGRLNPFVPTGHYDFQTQTITLYIGNRHVKDILRSFAHELVHHSQFLRDPEGFKTFAKSGKLTDNQILRKYESEAYTDGNLLFRQWTEDQTA